jgi:hypothetical protein
VRGASTVTRARPRRVRADAVPAGASGNARAGAGRLHGRAVPHGGAERGAWVLGAAGADGCRRAAAAGGCRGEAERGAVRGVRRVGHRWHAGSLRLFYGHGICLLQDRVRLAASQL